MRMRSGLSTGIRQLAVKLSPFGIAIAYVALLSLSSGCGGGGSSSPPPSFTRAATVPSYGYSSDIYGSPSVLLHRASIGAQPDIVTIDNTNYQLHFWRNQGGGSFSTKPASATNRALNGFAWGLSGGNNLNLGMGTSASHVVTVAGSTLHRFAFDANGQYLPASSSASSIAPLVAAQFPVIGDVTGDGFTDVVIVEKNNKATPPGSGYAVRYQLQTVAGNTVGTCSENNGAPARYAAARPLLSDLDGDGDLDLVLASFPDKQKHMRGPVFVVENVNGVLSTNCIVLKEHGVFANGLHPSGLDAADMNGDGKMDIVVGNFAAGGVAIFPGKGVIGGFAASVPVLWKGGLMVNGLTVADVNGDGFKDVVAADADTNTPAIDIYFGDGKLGATFQALKADVLPTAVAPSGSPRYVVYHWNPKTAPFDVKVVDINQDGKLDIITANYNPAGAQPVGNQATSTSSFSIVLQQ